MNSIEKGLTCIVSKQISQENFEIGVMVKAKPSSELDSGWSFLSGAESDEYFENPDYMEVILLSQILHKNKKIEKFLKCPVDTVVSKNDDGEFYILDNQNKNSEILFNQDNSLNLNLNSDNINNEQNKQGVNLYDDIDMNVNNLSEQDFYNIKQFISNNFGNFDGIYKEIISEEISCNICIVPPNETYDYYKVITIGASSLDMNLPSNLKDKNLERFELVMFLPNDWKFEFDKIFQDENQSEQWYMPINILKHIARLPFENNTWLGYGHTICFKDSLKIGQFSNFILDIPNNLLETKFLKLENGKIINFYCVIPVLDDEINFSLKNQAENLLEKIYDKNNNQVIDIDRKTCLN